MFMPINYIKIFKALSDETRLSILQRIAMTDEVCVCKLTYEFAIAQSKLSYHLKLLLDANLITVTPQGKWNFYSANKKILREVFTNEALRNLIKLC